MTPAALSTDQITDYNVRYHDAAASEYDGKWNITFDELARDQITRKLRKALGAEPGALGRSLEIGAGTGYFTLNLLRSGLVESAVATDISQGMLDALEGSAERLGLEVETARCEASELPFPDDSFDFVVGHAVLHHLPRLDAAFAEFRRVLRPGGRIAFCGEPSRHGDRLSQWPKRAGARLGPVWRRLVGASERRENGHGVAPETGEPLEFLVDVHAFTPGDLARHAHAAGFQAVRICGEELTAAWFGWLNRCLEATADPDEIPQLWYRYAYHGYLALQRLDRAALEPHLPPAIFYNLLISARA